MAWQVVFAFRNLTSKFPTAWCYRSECHSDGAKRRKNLTKASSSREILPPSGRALPSPSFQARNDIESFLCGLGLPMVGMTHVMRKAWQAEFDKPALSLFFANLHFCIFAVSTMSASSQHAAGCMRSRRNGTRNLRFEISFLRIAPYSHAFCLPGESALHTFAEGK